MTEQELIEQWVRNNRPEVVKPTLFVQQRVDLIKELIESPSEQQYKLVELEVHYIRKHQKGEQ